MNYAISLLKHLSAWLIINGWLPMDDRQMRWTTYQVGFFSLLQLACLLFECRLFLIKVLHNVIFFCLIWQVCCGGFLHHEIADTFSSCPFLFYCCWVFFYYYLCFFLCVCVFTYQSPTNPDLALTDCEARCCPWGMWGVREHTNALLPSGLVSKNATSKSISHGPHKTGV